MQRGLIRLGVIAMLAIVTTAAPASASAQTPLSVATPVMGEIIAVDQVDSYTFSVPPDTRVYLERLASNNAAKLNWRLSDSLGRVIDADLGNLNDMGPFNLMGGDYMLEVFGEAGALGDYEVVVHEVVDGTSTAPLNQPLTGEITTPGQTWQHTFTLSDAARVYVDHTGGSNNNRLNWRLNDALGNQVFARTTSLADRGPYQLPAGTHTLTVLGEDHALGTYDFTLVTVPETSTAILLDTTVTGEITAPGETTRHPFVTPPGTSVFVEFLQSSDGGGLNWRLESATGAVPFDWTTSLSSTGPYLVSGTDHTLHIRSESGRVGTYEFVIHTVADTSELAAVDTAISGTIDTPGQRHTYVFAADDGDRVAFEALSSAAGSSFNWSLTNTDGRSYVNRTTSWSSSGPVTLTEGVYQLAVQTEGAVTGDFEFQLRSVIDVGTITSLGSTVAGSIDLGSIHRHTFSAPAGTLLTIQRDTTTNNNGLNFQVVDAAGLNVIARGSNLTSKGPVALMGGTYTLEVLGETGQTGTYELTLLDGGPSGYVTPAGQALVLDQLTTAAVDPNASLSYTLALAADAPIYWDLVSGANGLTWTLTDSSGRKLVDNGRARYASDDIDPGVLRAGTYHLSIANSTAGVLTAEFAARQGTIDTSTGTLDVEQTISVTGVGGWHDIEFTLASDQKVFLDIDGSDSTDNRWSMTDTVGQPLFGSTRARYSDEDQGPWVLAAGTHRIRMAPVKDATPTLTFTLRSVTDTVATAAVGDTVIADIDGPGAEHAVDFSLAASTAVYLDLTTGVDKIDWRLDQRAANAPAGTVFGWQEAQYADSHDQGPFTLPAGDYRLRVNGRNHVHAPITFALVEQPTATPVAIAVDTPFDVEVAVAGATEIRTLTLTAETGVYIDTTTASTNTYVDVYDDAGRYFVQGLRLNATSKDAGPLVLPAGDYTLEFSNDGRPAPTVSMTVHTVTDATGPALTANTLETMAVAGPGSTLTRSFTPTQAGASYLFDLMSDAANSSRWTLLDPVGTPVFGPANAYRWASHDQGPFPLRAGTYTLVLNPELDGTSPLDLIIFDASTMDPAADGCADCSALDVAFAFDTSGSMSDNVAQLCSLSTELVAGLAQRGIPVTATYWGIGGLDSNNPCLTSTVLDELGANVPGLGGAAPPEGLEELNVCLNGGAGDIENWGPAAAIVAERFPWQPDAARLVIPVADEGPYCGDGLDEYDVVSVDHAAAVATANNVTLSPIMPPEVGDPLRVHGFNMANQSGGRLLVASFEPDELLPQLNALAAAACTTQADPVRPELSELSPPAHQVLPAGQPFVVSGRFTAVNDLRPLVDVRINGESADSFDFAGRFFHTVTLEPGETTLVIEAVESCGSFESTFTLSTRAPGQVTAEDLIEVVDFSRAYKDTTFQQGLKQVFFDTAVTNEGSFIVDGPVLLVVGSDLDPRVDLHNADGFTADGRGYYEVVAAGASLAPGDTAPWVRTILRNPEQAPIRHSVSYLMADNRVPVFTSAPTVSASPGVTWSYPATAFDPDGHAVSWALVAGPVAATVSTTPDGHATIAWTPTANDIGGHDMIVMIDDGRGGTALQRFTVTVSVGGGNSPPVFTSPAVTHASVGEPYAYDADAVDADGDDIAFALTQGPAGMTVDAATGEVTWPYALPGNHDIELTASDSGGGSAVQAWRLSVGVLSPNQHAPIITSTPVTTTLAGGAWLYPVVASDPDGDVLTTTLVAGPPGMSADPTTGRVTWGPAASDLGSHPVTVRVSDGLGGAAQQSFTLSVVTTLPNQAPRFTSSPIGVGLSGTVYTYTIEVVDPEDDAVTLGFAPGGDAGGDASLVGNTLTWTPTAADATSGQVALAVTATDSAGNASSQAWLVNVRETNAAPVFTSLPPSLTIAAGASWVWGLSAVDPDGDAVAFMADAGAPAGVSVDPFTGVLRWAPTDADAGDYTFTVSATDPFGASTLQTVTVTVFVDTVPPVVVLQHPDETCIGQPTQVCVNASDETAIGGRTLEIDGQPEPLDAAGCAVLTRASEATVALAATAIDTSDNVGAANANMAVIDCNDYERPIVSLLSPVAESVLMAPVEIIGSVSDDNPASLSWVVKIARGDSDDFTVIGEGTGPRTDEVLATLDTTMLANDTYRVQIVADDGQNTGGIDFNYHIGGDHKLGNFEITVLDLGIPVAGLALSIVRSYNSIDTNNYDFGAGWKLQLSGEVRDSADEIDSDIGLVQLLGQEPFTRSTRVTVTRPDGRRVGFTFAPVANGFPTPLHVTSAFRADEDNTGSLKAAGQQRINDYGGVFFEWAIPYNPTDYIYTTEDGVKWFISETEGVTKVEDLNGNTIVFGADGISHSAGPSLTFERDGDGRITKIIAPDDPTDAEPPKELTYAYDAIGNLVSFTDATNATTSYHYDEPAFPHYLTSIVDPEGRPVMRNVFDDDGRVIASCGPEGDLVTLEGCQVLEHDPMNGSSTVYDAEGNRTDFLYDERGNVAVERRWADETTFYDWVATYDDRNNQLTRTDPLNNTTTWTYDDRGRETSRTDAAGRVWSQTWHPTCNAVVEACDPLNNCTISAYDDTCHVGGQRDPTGGITLRAYTSRGQMSHYVDEHQNTWEMTFDAGGRCTARIDPRGNAQTFTYDVLGRRLTDTMRDGRTRTFVWDAADRLVAETWDTTPPTTTELAYNDAGDLLSLTTPDYTLTATYDAAGRMATISNAGSPGVPEVVLTYTYTKTDLVASVSDSLGGVTRYLYDGLSRLVAIEQTGASVSDKRVEFDYNAANLETQVRRFADLAGVDGVVSTAVGYDCAGCRMRKNAVTHRRMDDSSIINDIQLTRDDVFNVVEMSDSDGLHSYVHDGSRRLISVTNTNPTIPDESFSYDPIGNRVSADGESYIYDLDVTGNQLLEDSTWTYDYSLSGALLQRTHKVTGAYETYAYNHHQRLTEIVTHDASGTVINEAAFTYAGNGWRTKTVINGLVEHTMFDGDNPALVLADDGSITRRRLYSRRMDEVYAEEVAGETRWLLTDHLGSVRDVVDDSGTVLGHLGYSAFGKVVAETGSVDTPIRFTSRIHDDGIDLAFFRARFYSPSLGRFISEDPVGPWDYTYALNAPGLFTDPTGEIAAVSYARILAACELSAIVFTAAGWAKFNRGIFDHVNKSLEAALSGGPQPPPFELKFPLTPQSILFSALTCGLVDLPGVLD